MLAQRKLPVVVLATLVAVSAASCDPTRIDPGDLFSTGVHLKADPPAATVVLVHGMGGFKKVGPVDYFFNVPQLWRRLGAKFHVAAQTPYASVEKRAAELKSQLDRIAGPLILVGHSQGGLDARYLVSRLGYADRVRAVVTIATPHRGSPLADIALGLTPGIVEDAADVIIGVLGWSLDGARQVTTSYMNSTFNPTVPDVPGVAYWSFAGRASPLALDRGSGWLHSPLLPSWSILKALRLDSDGVVPVASQRWGTFVAELPADHIGEVNMPFGETPGWHALAFYAQLLQRLHDAGW